MRLSFFYMKGVKYPSFQTVNGCSSFAISLTLLVVWMSWTFSYKGKNIQSWFCSRHCLDWVIIDCLHQRYREGQTGTFWKITNVLWLLDNWQNCTNWQTNGLTWRNWSTMIIWFCKPGTNFLSHTPPCSLSAWPYFQCLAAPTYVCRLSLIWITSRLTEDCLNVCTKLNLTSYYVNFKEMCGKMQQ